MTFNEGARLDPSQAEDRRGRGSMGRGGKMGLGLGGGIVVLIGALLGINPDLLNSILGDTGEQPAIEQSGGSALENCQTGADANANLDCRILGTANALNSFWPGYLNEYGVKYSVPKTVIFTGSVDTACGAATSAVGPFYCPGDNNAYFDPDFFAQLETQFGSSGGPLAQEYVVAHEFGHHVQDLTGTIGKAQQDPKGAQSAAVRTELQADCYAGIWMRYASTKPAPGGSQPFLKPLVQSDLNDALSAASSVGDDRIQKAATGRTNPESWTHGSSEQRQKWLYKGYQSADLEACDTFSVPNV
ncbi:neutral zinc metallopeptidase [Arthrobacter sp. N199823]|uniref:KPN_02809 family neutral zinc metallopeptidase n=1 Tax=Arthrobacter sp. N199823 TaxID=2058895 RepID=UPI000CE2E3F8|nr:neutral zinc metallopeptidase [Arthrobacter sp. N199823]